MVNFWETLFIHMHHKQDLLISEQQSSDTNPFFELAVTPHSLHSIPPRSVALTDTIDTHTKGQDTQPNTDSTHRRGQHWNKTCNFS
jgi:hypothetical protein